MSSPTQLPLITLMLMISFASVNAVLFTPALPNIAHFFAISDHTAQQTLTWFLIGYAIGQLVYGPLANRFGRKPALYAGISVQIISSLLCIFSGVAHEYLLMVVGRFLLALGSGVGLKMTFTLVNECYPSKIANQKIAYLMLAFAITPGLAIALGGVLNTVYGWASCFYAGAVYGIILMILVSRLPETKTVLDRDALQLKHLFENYVHQFKNTQLIVGGLLMGGASCFVYVFAALAPFIAINLLGVNSAEYGADNILPAVGLFIGSLFSAQFSKKYSCQAGIWWGILLAMIATVLMLVAMTMNLSPLIAIFLPMWLCYFGLALVLPNAASIAMSNVSDKSHGSAVMNFVNMGLVAVVVINLGWFSITAFLLPTIFLIIGAIMAGIHFVNRLIVV